MLLFYGQLNPDIETVTRFASHFTTPLIDINKYNFPK